MLVTILSQIVCLPISPLRTSRLILPVVFYWCETWFLIQMEEHRLRMSENRVLGRIVGPKAEEVVGG
jgi:hypothetical protein